MKLKSILNRIFRKNTQEIEARLVALKDIVPLPTRESFLSCPEKLKQIDEYMNEYLRTLKRNKTIVSTHLMPKELHDYKDIYSNLLINLTLDDNSEVSFEKVNTKESGDEYLDIIIKKLKIALYQNDVSKLREEAELRIAALLEILNNKVFSKNKTNAILNEINNLHYALVIFLSQEEAMRKEAYAYLKDIEGLDDEEFLSESEKEELIIIRLKENQEIAELLIPEKLRDLKKRNLSPELLLAKLEQLLEIYVSTHSEELDSLRDETKRLSYEINYNMNVPVFEDSEEFIKQHDEYLERIKVLELKYKAFSKYGRNMVNKEDLRVLYQIKFRLLTIDILTNEKIDLISDATYTELECYQDIVSKKIEKILKGENYRVNYLATNKVSIPEVINLIKEVLKQDEEFSFYHILGNRILLSFLLSFDEVYGLEDFFKKFKINRLNYDVYYYDNNYVQLFSWDKYLPLATIFNVMKSNIETNTYLYKYQYSTGISYDPLFEIYKLALPTFGYGMCFEGLIKINIPDRVEKMPNYAPIIKYIRKKAKGQDIHLPSTLKSFKGNLFADCGIKSINLNEGLEKIGDYALLIPMLQDITFPSTLKYLSLKALDFHQFASIGIRNPLHSIIINDDQILERLISRCYWCYSLVNNHDDIFPFYVEAGPSFEMIRLSDENGVLDFSKILHRDDLTCTLVKKNINAELRPELSYDDILIIKVRIRSKIAEKLSLEDNTYFGRVRKQK